MWFDLQAMRLWGRALEADGNREQQTERKRTEALYRKLLVISTGPSMMSRNHVVVVLRTKSHRLKGSQKHFGISLC